MAFTEALILRTDDRIAPSPVTLSGDDRFSDVVTLSRDHSWRLPLADADELAKLGWWLVEQAGLIKEAKT